MSRYVKSLTSSHTNLPLRHANTSLPAAAGLGEQVFWVEEAFCRSHLVLSTQYSTVMSAVPCLSDNRDTEK